MLDCRKRVTLCVLSILSLKPQMDLHDTYDSLSFPDRRWSLGPVIHDSLLISWIQCLKKAGVKKGYGKVEISSSRCVHERVKRKWCFF